MPTISVILPVYNSEASLRRCVDSILAQKFTDFELLLINDGSKDSSGAICNEYVRKDSRVKAFHQNNGGVSSARNKGLDNAVGKWITFADSDDWVDADWLLIYKPYLSTESILVVQGFDYTEQGGTDMLFNSSIGYKGTIIDGTEALWSKPMPGAVWNKLFSKDVIVQNSLRFDNSLCIQEDEDFVVRYMSYMTNLEMIYSSSYKYFQPLWTDKYSNMFSLESTYKVISSLCKLTEDYSHFNVLKTKVQLFCNDYFGMYNREEISCELLNATKYFLKLKQSYPIKLLPLSDFTKIVLGMTNNPQLIMVFFRIKRLLAGNRV